MSRFPESRAEIITNEAEHMESDYIIERCRDVLKRMAAVRDKDYGLSIALNTATRCDDYEKLMSELNGILQE